MQVGLVALEAAAAHLAEGYARAVVGVNVGRYLEYEARELGLFRLNHAFLGLRGTRTWGYLNKAIEQFLHAEVVKRAAEEHRRHLGRTVVLNIELRVNTVHKLKIFTQFGRVGLANVSLQLIARNVNLNLLGDTLLVGREQVELVLVNVVNALELRTLVDGPRQRAHLYLKFLLQLVKKVKGVAPFAVHLVDEDYHRRVAHAAHVHQLARLRLHALGSVHYDYGRVNSRERAVSVFGEVLVTRRVKYVDLVTFIVKLHDRRGHGYSALFLYVHPVRRCRLAYLVVLHRSGHLYLSSEKKELLGKRGLTRVRVRYDGERAPSFDFLVHFFKFKKLLELKKSQPLPTKDGGMKRFNFSIFSRILQGCPQYHSRTNGRLCQVRYFPY